VLNPSHDVYIAATEEARSGLTGRETAVSVSKMIMKL
jgi:hypothetical protein